MNKFDKLYFAALKKSAKAARTVSGGKKISSDKRWATRHNAEKSVTRRPWPIKDDWEKEILEGMARLAWSDYWASEQENKASEGKRHYEFSAGEDIYESAPPTRSPARVWAKKVAAQILRMNNVPSLTHLFNLVREKYDYPKDAESFGNDLAFEALGHGVNWTDRLKDYKKAPKRGEAFKMPHSEFYI
jgi:hypothetical protein